MTEPAAGQGGRADAAVRDTIAQVQAVLGQLADLEPRLAAAGSAEVEMSLLERATELVEEAGRLLEDLGRLAV